MSESRKYTIANIPGDGVGNEVIPEGQRVLEYVAELSAGEFEFEFQSFPWGSDYYAEHGRMMAEDGLEQLKQFDAIYFGAVGWENVPDHVSLWGLRLAITQNFDQWANIRPVHFYSGVKSALNYHDLESLDWLLIRENSEGEYAGFGGRNFSGRGDGKEIAVQSAVFTEEGCERIIRHAFEVARTRSRKKVTSATKSNAQQYGMVLCVAMGIGVFMPPVGIGYYVACAIGDAPVNATMRPALIYSMFIVLGLIVVILFPQLTVWLPHHFGMH